jgi:hypothetical protein
VQVATEPRIEDWEAIDLRLRARSVGLRHDAEEIAAWILKHNEVRARPIPPWITRSPKRYQTLDFSLLIGSIEIEVNPIAMRWTSVSCLKRQVRSSTARIAEHNPPTTRGLPRNVMQRILPESHRSIELMTVNNDRADLHYRTLKVERDVLDQS